MTTSTGRWRVFLLIINKWSLQMYIYQLLFLFMWHAPWFYVKNKAFEGTSSRNLIFFYYFSRHENFLMGSRELNAWYSATLPPEILSANGLDTIKLLKIQDVLCNVTYSINIVHRWMSHFQQNTKLILCSSTKYPYLPHGRDFL